ncbi:MAG: dephospho-CoA kinase [Terriglobia bacterium]
MTCFRCSGLFGLTGGIASGKSTVAATFAALGAKIIDADRIGHEVLRQPGPAFDEVVRQFGEGVLDTSGEIDRKLLGRIVFADPAKRLALNAIVHPRIIARQEELAQQARREDPTAVIVVEAALIYEAGIEGRFNGIIVAWCEPDQQIERLKAKAGLSREEAAARVAAQMPAEEKRRRAGFVIDCSRSIDEARRQTGQVYLQLKQLAGEAQRE